MVIPTTAHAAFDKAAQFLKIKVKCVPVDPVTTCVDIKAMEKYINSRTIMVRSKNLNTINQKQNKTVTVTFSLWDLHQISPMAQSMISTAFQS